MKLIKLCKVNVIAILLIIQVILAAVFAIIKSLVGEIKIILFLMVIHIGIVRVIDIIANFTEYLRASLGMVALVLGVVVYCGIAVGAVIILLGLLVQNITIVGFLTIARLKEFLDGITTTFMGYIATTYDSCRADFDSIGVLQRGCVFWYLLQVVNWTLIHLYNLVYPIMIIVSIGALGVFLYLDRANFAYIVGLGFTTEALLCAAKMIAMYSVVMTAITALLTTFGRDLGKWAKELKIVTAVYDINDTPPYIA